MIHCTKAGQPTLRFSVLQEPAFGHASRNQPKSASAAQSVSNFNGDKSAFPDASSADAQAPARVAILIAGLHLI
jgi:hypothetical protein